MDLAGLRPVSPVIEFVNSQLWIAIDLQILAGLNRKTALEIAAVIRPANKFSRVGMSFVERIEAKVRAAIREEVRIHPSKGKTLL